MEALLGQHQGLHGERVKRTLFEQNQNLSKGMESQGESRKSHLVSPVESQTSKGFSSRRPSSTTSTATKETSASAASQARMLASEAKSIEVAVLRLYDSSTTVDEIDETIFGNHDEVCTFENPLVKLCGVCEIRSLFQLMKKIFWSFNIIRPVKVGLWLGGKDGEGAKLLLDFKVEYQVLPLTPKVVIHQFTHLTISLEGRVVEHKDDWSVGSLIENIPFVGTFLYPLKQRCLGLISSSLGGVIQPRASFIYKLLLQEG